MLNHLPRLCANPVLVADLSSSAAITRLLSNGMINTILLDEVDRMLKPGRAGVDGLLSTLNSGYRTGGYRLVTERVAGVGHAPKCLPTFAPVAMAGNDPNLPADTASRQIRILLMPALDGVEESEWELISTDAERLQRRCRAWADQVRNEVKGLAVQLPDGCRNRSRDKWQPLARVAAVAGGDWPTAVVKLIEVDLQKDAAQREVEMIPEPPALVVMRDLFAVWPPGEPFVPTRGLVDLLLAWHDYWGPTGPLGKSLNETQLGRLINRATQSVRSIRPHTQGPRGYARASLEPTWRGLGLLSDNPDTLARSDPGSSSYRGLAQ